MMVVSPNPPTLPPPRSIQLLTAPPATQPSLPPPPPNCLATPLITATCIRCVRPRHAPVPSEMSLRSEFETVCFHVCRSFPDCIIIFFVPSLWSEPTPKNFLPTDQSPPRPRGSVGGCIFTLGLGRRTILSPTEPRNLSKLIHFDLRSLPEAETTHPT